MLRVHDHQFQMDRVVLAPGEYFSCRESLILYTVLGSCVAVCLRDNQSGICGMNHFMLPEPPRSSLTGRGKDGRFGSYAMQLLVDQLLSLGANRSQLIAKVFGGGNVLVQGARKNPLPASNVQFALDYLRLEQIPITAQDVGGQRGRRVAFHTASGHVYVQKLRTAEEIDSLQAPVPLSPGALTSRPSVLAPSTLAPESRSFRSRLPDGPPSTTTLAPLSTLDRKRTLLP